MKTKIMKLALIATSGALLGSQAYGQSAGADTNGPLVIQATNAAPTAPATTPLLTISPEVRTEMIYAAAREIGSPPTNDLGDLLTRQGDLKQKVQAIQARHARAATNVPPVPMPPATTGAGLPKAQPIPTVDELNRVIGQLSVIGDQLSKTPPSPAAQ
jgi:hypothetical protein